MSIIIVEGCDLSGKSYAIERIGKHFNSGITLKNNFKPKSISHSALLFAQYWKIINFITSYDSPDSKSIIILDRFYLSQQVYSFLRGREDMQHKEIFAIEKYCKEQEFKLIYLDTPLKTLQSRYDIRGDEHVSKDLLAKLKSRYDDAFNISILDKMKLDTTKEDWLKDVEEFIK